MKIRDLNKVVTIGRRRFREKKMSLWPHFSLNCFVYPECISTFRLCDKADIRKTISKEFTAPARD